MGRLVLKHRPDSRIVEPHLQRRCRDDRVREAIDVGVLRGRPPDPRVCRVVEPMSDRLERSPRPGPLCDVPRGRRRPDREAQPGRA